MLELDVIAEPAAAACALDPMRRRILAALHAPGSATTVAAVLGETRQKVNYHLRSLERHVLVELVEERPRRGVTERVMVASASSYVVSPDVVADEPVDPDRYDRMSARYLVALAARLVREVATMSRDARKAGKPLATLAIETQITFGSAAERAEFGQELATAISQLAARYHSGDATDGRPHRLVVGAHPMPRVPDATRTDPDPTM